MATNSSFRHLKVSFERHNKVEQSELFSNVIGSAHRIHKLGGQLLYAGFEGITVARNRSFGNRWHTFAMEEEEAVESIADSLSLEPTIVDYAFWTHRGTGKILPAIGIFKAEDLYLLYQHKELWARYVREEGDIPGPIGEYGVNGDSLDSATVAVIYFMPRQKSSTPEL